MASCWVAASMDLVEVAQAVAEDDRSRVAAWLQAGQVAKVAEALAQDYLARAPELWAVVVSPWVADPGARRWCITALIRVICVLYCWSRMRLLTRKERRHV